MIGHIVRAILKEYCTANNKKILPASQSAWNTRFYFGHQKLCMDNNDNYYPYRAFGDQNKSVYSTRFVTRKAIILLLPGVCDKEGNNIIIARQ